MCGAAHPTSHQLKLSQHIRVLVDDRPREALRLAHPPDELVLVHRLDDRRVRPDRLLHVRNLLARVPAPVVELQVGPVQLHAHRLRPIGGRVVDVVVRVEPSDLLDPDGAAGGVPLAQRAQLLERGGELPVLVPREVLEVAEPDRGPRVLDQPV